MDTREFYKAFYFKELSTKTELNNAVNLPIAIITAIITVHGYIFTHCEPRIALIIGIISVYTGVQLIRSLYFLNKSYNNLGGKFDYMELSDMGSFLEFEKKLKEKDNAEEQFNNHCCQQYAICAENNFKLNKGRTEDLASAKVALFHALYASMLSSIIYIATIKSI